LFFFFKNVNVDDFYYLNNIHLKVNGGILFTILKLTEPILIFFLSSIELPIKYCDLKL